MKKGELKFNYNRSYKRYNYKRIYVIKNQRKNVFKFQNFRVQFEITLHLHSISARKYCWAKTNTFIQNSITIWNKNNKNLQIRPKFVRFYFGVFLLVWRVFYLYWYVTWNSVFKNCSGQNFKFSIFCLGFPEHHANQNQRSSVSFQKKSSMRFIPHIISSKMLLGYTDTVLGRPYAIGVQCFSADMLSGHF